jgi:hypothetical protein
MRPSEQMHVCLKRNYEGYKLVMGKAINFVTKENK